MENLTTDIHNHADISVNLNTTDNKNFSLNFSETEKFIDYLLTNKSLLPPSLQQSLLGLIAQLQKLLVNKDSDKDNTFSLKRLCLTLIERDPNLQDRVAQDLSSSKKLICTKDAKEELLKRLQNLSPSFSENTKSLASLLRFLCEILLNLTNKKLLGAGLEHDLISANIAIPRYNLGIKHQICAERILQASLAYICLNQQDYLLDLAKKTKEINKVPKKRIDSQRTTAQIMTHYLRRALEEFPEGTNYLDTLKYNKKDEEVKRYQDDLSEQTAKRIHDIIAKAANIAKAGNLIENKDPTIASSFEARATERHHLAKTLNDKKDDLKSDASQLSLKELAARASRLQEQFRKERQRLASEGKLPDPAKMPQPPKAPVKSIAKNQEEREILPREIESTGDPKQDQILRSLSSLASRSQVVAASIKAQQNPHNSDLKEKD